jgi:hypothetical protein
MDVGGFLAVGGSMDTRMSLLMLVPIYRSVKLYYKRKLKREMKSKVH